MVSTVVLAPAQAFTFGQGRFATVTVDVVQENQASSIAEVRVGVGVDGCTAAYLFAHNLGIAEGPAIITHRPPISLVVDLYTALA